MTDALMPAASAGPASRPALRINPNAVLAVVAVAQFMVILDSTVVNVALPTISAISGSPSRASLGSSTPTR